jgi:hypothetical protein
MANNKGGGGRRTPGLDAALATVRDLQQGMNKESKADYNVALGAAGVGSANLLQQTKGRGRTLAASIARAQTGVERVQAKGLRAKAEVERRRRTVTNAYGAGLGEVADRAFRPAGGVAAESAANLGAGAAVGRRTGQVGKDVRGIAQAGVKAGQAAAEYALAQALASRNSLTAETIAGLTGQLYQSALDYQMQWDMWKKQQDYAAKQAEKGGAISKQGAIYMMNTADTIAPDAADRFRTLRDAEKPINVAEEMRTYAKENGLQETDPEVLLYGATLTGMKRGLTAGEAWEEGMRKWYGGLPNWDKWGEALINGGKARDQLRQATAQALADYEAAKTEAEAEAARSPSGYRGNAETQAAEKGLVPAGTARPGMAGVPLWKDRQGNLYKWDPINERFVAVNADGTQAPTMGPSY